MPVTALCETGQLSGVIITVIHEQSGLNGDVVQRPALIGFRPSCGRRQEVFQHLVAVFGQDRFRVELQAKGRMFPVP